MVSRTKTSIYVDRELWERFRRYARSKGIEVSRLLEEMIREEMLEEELSNAIDELGVGELEELDFEPITPKGGLVSTLVRELRDERDNSLSRQ